MAKRYSVTRDQAEAVAVQALSFLAEDPERLSRFLALSGLDLGAIRAAAADPGFLVGVLEHVAGDEGLLVAFAAAGGMAPEAVDRAYRILAGPGIERDIP